MKRILCLFLILVCLLMTTSCDYLAALLGDGTEATSETAHICDFTLEVAEEQYLRATATCERPALYYHSCSCGLMGSTWFSYGEMGEHTFSVKKAGKEYLKRGATVNSPATYYKSCQCGAIGEETFTYGGKLKAEAYTPCSLTVTMYDAASSVYGFTYNSVKEPVDPVIRIKKVGETEFLEFSFASEKATSYDRDDKGISYYISKAEASLLPDTSYVYYLYDKSTEVATDEMTLTTGNPNAESFTFVHVSDSQGGATEFGRVLAAVADDADFLIHTGDVVEYSKYEEEWEEMLDGNAEYLTGLPVMPISGNHETTYRNGSNETDKHFNNGMPTQNSTDLGYFYSFIYGNVKFIMLNTNDLTSSKQLKPEQYNWLVAELASNTCRFTVVSMHNPMYSVGKYGANPESNAIALALRAQLGGLFAEYGVDLVLQGHDHVVSRTYALDANGVAVTETVETVNGVDYLLDPQGVIYIMNGPAGSQTRSPYEVDADLYAYAEASKKASWAEIKVDGDTLTVTVKWSDSTGEHTYRTFGIKKS